jgi:hypothetical protein
MLDHTLGRLRRFRLFPMHTLSVRSGVAQRLHAKRTAKARRWLEDRDFLPLLQARDAEALPQDAADLRHLYEAVTRQRPERVIEFGSGQSTIFIAQALHDIGAGHLWTLDADAHWLANSKRSLPHHLRRFVTFVHSPAIVHKDYGVPAFRYSVVPPGEWDFVLVDGPALTPEVSLSTDLIDLPLAAKAKGMIDHRWRSAVIAKEQRKRLKLSFMPSLESFAIG